MISEIKPDLEVNSVRQEISGLAARVFIDEFELILSNIRSIQIRQWVFDLVPRINIVFRDDDLFFNLSTLKDSSIIRLQVAVSEEDANKKEYQFCLSDFDFYKVQNVATVEVSGYLKTKNLFSPITSRAFRQKTSLDCVKDIAGTLGLNFKSSDGLRPSDRMTWLQTLSNFDFLKYLWSKSSIPDDLPLIFADLDGNLNYRALNRELKSNLITELEYSTELFNIKTTEGLNQYKAKNNKPDRYGNFYGLKVKNIQQYLNFLAANGQSIIGLDYASGDKFERILAQKSYPVVTNNSDFKSAEGEIVNYEYVGINSESVFRDFLTVEAQNEYNLYSFFSQSLFTSINYLCQIELLDKVNLRVPSWINNDMTDINVPYYGTWIVGGIYTDFKVSEKAILPTKTLALFRPGFNNPIY